MDIENYDIEFKKYSGIYCSKFKWWLSIDIENHDIELILKTMKLNWKNIPTTQRDLRNIRVWSSLDPNHQTYQ